MRPMWSFSVKENSISSVVIQILSFRQKKNITTLYNRNIKNTHKRNIRLFLIWAQFMKFSSNILYKKFQHKFWEFKLLTNSFCKFSNKELNNKCISIKYRCIIQRTTCPKWWRPFSFSSKFLSFVGCVLTFDDISCYQRSNKNSGQGPLELHIAHALYIPLL